MSTLLWFQRDLRIQSNPALAYAIKLGEPIIALYIHSQKEDSPWSVGAASRWWLHQSLLSLSQDLKTLGIELKFYRGDSIVLIPQLASEYRVNQVLWSERGEPHRRSCENIIEQQLKHLNIGVKRFNPLLLTCSESFLTQTKKAPYRVFTPFYKRLRAQLFSSQEVTLQDTIPIEKRVAKTSGVKTKAKIKAQLSARLTPNLRLEQLNLIDRTPWSKKFHRYWIPGEKNARDKLHQFLQHPLLNYPSGRDIPSVDGTSSLSPHLHFGEISAHQIIHALQPYLHNFHQQPQGMPTEEVAESYLRQLIWREFAQYLLWHFPHTAENSMDNRFNKDFWLANPQRLQQWQQGDTGIPIIDAGMRQLWETGWMHNRVRMLTASYLTKNLGISWLEGARWFWDTLVDADLANNSMGWQWVAGCGVDAAPYYRIFNPQLQQQRFDPQQVYLKRWLDPRLALPSHKPQSVFSQPIDLKLSREQALSRYQQLKKAS